ncbi:4114_t:CDS:2, partial [Gigaspora margarita]
FTTVLNHSCITIKNLDAPNTVLLNGKSYKRIVDKSVHNDISDLLLPINNGSRLEAMVQANYVEYTEKNQKTTDIVDNREPINKFFKVTKRNQSVNLLENIRKDKQGSLQINDSEDEINDNAEDKLTSSDMNDIVEVQIATTINDIEKNKALLLKNNFEIVQKNQLI